MADDNDTLPALPQVPAGARKPWVAPRIDDAAALMRTHCTQPANTEVATSKNGS